MSKEKFEKQLAEAKEDLAALKKMKAGADEIKFAEDEISEIEEKLKSATDEKKSEPKKEEHKPAHKAEHKPVKKSHAARIMRSGRKKMVKKHNHVEKPAKKEKPEGYVEKRGRKKDPNKPAKKGKGLSTVYKGKTYYDTDPHFCDILIKGLEERKKKRKETGGKVKTRSLSAKVGDDISSSVITAIRGSFKENKEDILDSKASANKFLKAIVRIESAAERFSKEMKSVLADEFKQKDFDKEFKEVDDVIEQIKNTIKKSLKD